MNQTIDAIVNEVLYRLGHTTKVHLIQGLDYSNAEVERYGLSCYVTTFSELDASIPLMLPELTTSQMMSVASGIPVDEVSNWAIQALLCGICVYVDASTLGLYALPNVQTPLRRKHDEALAFLIESGLKIQRKKNDILWFEGDLLCEKQVIEWTRAGIQQVKLKKACVVTPAASDALRTSQMKWDKE